MRTTAARIQKTTAWDVCMDTQSSLVRWADENGASLYYAIRPTVLGGRFSASAKTCAQVCAFIQCKVSHSRCQKPQIDP